MRPALRYIHCTDACWIKRTIDQSFNQSCNHSINQSWQWWWTRWIVFLPMSNGRIWYGTIMVSWNPARLPLRTKIQSKACTFCPSLGYACQGIPQDGDKSNQGNMGEIGISDPGRDLLRPGTRKCCSKGGQCVSPREYEKDYFSHPIGYVQNFTEDAYHTDQCGWDQWARNDNLTNSLPTTCICFHLD